MPSISRRLVPSEKIRREAIWASGTSIRASVRTLAALVSEKPMNQNCEAAAPRKPAKSDLRQFRRLEHQRRPVGGQHVERQDQRLQEEAERQDRGRPDEEAALGQRLDRAAIADRREREEGAGARRRA